MPSTPGIFFSPMRTLLPIITLLSMPPTLANARLTTAAFTNWAETASAVAFLQMPRRHLMHSWKSLGVTVLKTVRFQPEGSAVRFRREAADDAHADGSRASDKQRSHMPVPPFFFFLNDIII